MKALFFKLSFVFMILSFFAINQGKSQSYQNLEFNGYNSATSLGNYVTTANASTLIAGASAVSMTGWFYTNALAYGQGLIGFRSSGVTFYMVTVSNGDVIEDRITNAAGTLYQPVCPAGTIAPNIWQHIAFVYDGTKAYLYVNGTQVANIAATGALPTTTTAPFVMGWSPCPGYNFYFNGNMDEVSLWKKALTASQIQNIMANEIADTAQGLELYYKFDQGVPGGNNTGITTLHTDVNSPTYDGVITNFTMTGAVSNFEGTVDTSSQVISFPTIPTKLISSPPFALAATSTSGLTVSYNILSGPATVNGNTVTLTGATGLVSVRAYQLGNAQYDSAASVINTFEVVDPSANVPIIDPRHPLAGNVYMPTLSKIQLAAVASIDYTDVFSVTGLYYKIDGIDSITTTNFQNGCFTAWWLPSSYGNHTIQIFSTNNFGATGSITYNVNVTATAPDTSFTAFTGVINNDVSVQAVTIDGCVLPSYIGAYDTIIATLTVSCPPGGCGAWDYVRSVRAQSHEGNWFEIIRYITPYGTPCVHKINVADYMSILCGKVNFVITGGIDNGYDYALSFEYKPGAPPHKYSQVTQIWENNYNFGYYPDLEPVSVSNYSFPANVVASTLKLTTTGHGGGDDNTDNAAEFYEATHHIHINNVDSFAQHLWQTCNPNPDGCSPQSGTWQYSRAGWCPGSIAHPFDYDLTTYIPSNNIAIQYVFFPGYIDECNTSYPPCVSGTTCSDCSGGTIPILDVDCNVVNFFDTPPGTPVIQAVKELTEFGIAVYPNPSTGVFNLTCNNRPDNPCTVIIYNLMGNIVKEFEWNGDNTTFNLSNYASGIYIMKVSNKDKVEVKKLMVR